MDTSRPESLALRPPRPRRPARPLSRRARMLLPGLLAALLLVGAAVVLPMTRPVAALPAPLPGDPVRQARSAQLATDLRLVNYYPGDRAWERMWTRFSETRLRADFARVKGLGATTVRLIVFPDVLGYPQPTAARQAQLARAVQLADQAGLRVFLTLYDNFDRYGDLAGSRTWTRAVLQPWAGDERLEVVELRNEIDPRDAAATSWARDQVGLVHELVPSVPVTLSLNGSADPALYRTLSDALLPQVLDVVSYHYYGDPGLAYDHFRRAVAAVAPVPVVVGETGAATEERADRCPDRACRESEQADWYQVVTAAALQAGLAPPAPWMLSDLTAEATDRPLAPAECCFGLFRADGGSKPAARVVSDAFAGRVAAGPQNTGFTATTMGGLRAPGWWPWLVSGRFRVEPGQGVDGGAALAVSGTVARSDGIAGWYANPVQAVQQGQTWHAAVWARGAGASGQTTLMLAWFDGDGRWLGNSESPRLDLSVPGWQSLRVDASPPAAARALQIHLSSGGNGGTVWFSAPGWRVDPPR